MKNYNKDEASNELNSIECTFLRDSKTERESERKGDAMKKKIQPKSN